MSQVIKKDLKKDNVENILKLICQPYKTYIKCNKFYYKKLLIENKLSDILNKLEPYYYNSKKYYLKNTTYNGLTTILRQLCKLFNIPYTSKIIYNKSKYIIEYYIYL